MFYTSHIDYTLIVIDCLMCDGFFSFLVKSDVNLAFKALLLENTKQVSNVVISC